MEPFPTPALAWAPGETRWHAYVVPEPDNEPLARLIERTRQVSLDIAGDALAPVGDFAHATVHMISLPADQLPPESLSNLAKELRARLAEMPLFQVTVGDASAGTGSVCLNMDRDMPGEPWAVLTDTVGAAIGSVFGPHAQQYDPPRPHVTVAYCAEPTDSGKIQSALRRLVTPSRATMTVGCIWLVNVAQSVPENSYTWPWDTAVRIPLSGPSHPGYDG